METSEILQNWLKYLGREYTQKRLAIESGLSKTTISFIVNGRTKPDTESIKKISKAIGITISEFWEGPEIYEANKLKKMPNPGISIKGEIISDKDIKLAIIMKKLSQIDKTEILDYVIKYVSFETLHGESE